MKICYNKLWKLLIDKNMKRGKLRELSGISAATMAKLSRGANVNTEVLIRLCAALDCDLFDIMELER